jgi:hypothetical protein
LLVALALSASVPGEAPATDAGAPPDAAAVAALIERAEAARRRAAELGAEWLDTGAMIRQAREEAARGKLDQAAELAEVAQRQGELAAAQAEREAVAWQRRVVR